MQTRCATRKKSCRKQTSELNSRTMSFRVSLTAAATTQIQAVNSSVAAQAAARYREAITHHNLSHVLLPAPFVARRWQSVVSNIVAVVWLSSSLSACSGECGSGERLIDGVCLAPCEADACGDGLTCVRNVCRPECTSNDQCKAADTCQKVRNDDGEVGRYCYGQAMAESPYRRTSSADVNDGGSEPSSQCQTSAQCPQDVPRHCIAGNCETECTLHEHCGRAGACTGAATLSEGRAIAFCQPDTLPRDVGQFGSTCLTSTASCDSNNDFMCLTRGEGDTESYCTLRGCDSDADCPSGLFCSHNVVGSRPPCETTCAVAGSPQDANCIEASDIGPGRPYRCLPAGGLELTLCLERTFCVSCETDADCRSEANQVCARGPDGNKTCTVTCAPGLGSCPWGSATQCAVFDTELGVPTCAPLFGACRGSGKSCEPCVDDADCPNGFCSVSSFTGEQFCFDETVSCACEAGAESCVGGGCPLTPSGLRMNCLSIAQGQPPNVCYGAENAVESGTPLGCW